jgi:hypothetical protein
VPSTLSNGSYPPLPVSYFPFRTGTVKRNAGLLHYSVVGTHRTLGRPAAKGRFPCPPRVPPGRIRVGPGPTRMRLPPNGEDD